MRGDQGPPEKERPSGSQAARPNQKSATDTDKPKITAQPRHFHAGGRRRREAALRLPPIGRCGCIRDPDRDRHRCGARPLSDHQVDGWRATAQHLLAVGCPPILELDTLRALHKRGGDDRKLARELYQLAGGDVG